MRDVKPAGMSQQKRSEATRARLIESFIHLFLSEGVERTTTEAVLAETGLSKGALYHHFSSKVEVVEAIYTQTSRRAIDRALLSTKHVESPIARIKAACLAWLREIEEPATAKILFEIGPQALGIKRAKEIEDSLSLSYFQQMLDEAVKRGELDVADPILTAHLLNAVMAELAIYSLRTGTDVRVAAERAINGLLWV